MDRDESLLFNKNIVYESIDRLLLVEVRLPFLVRGTLPGLYRAARGSGRPLTRQIAQAIYACLERGNKRFLIVTGFYDPRVLPHGESDGLYGAAALGKALGRLGARVSYAVEEECLEPMEALVGAIEAGGDIVPLRRGDGQSEINGKLEDGCDAAVFIEKCGPSPLGVYHYATANPRDEGLDADMGLFLRRMSAKGKPTIGIGDYGNEIGFGRILREALDITGRSCNCPYNEGMVTCYATDYLLPCCVSNIGAYGIISALALLLGRPDILHTSRDEMTLIRTGNQKGVMEGSYGAVRDSVDGVPAAALCGYIEILGALPAQFYEDIHDRGF